MTYSKLTSNGGRAYNEDNIQIEYNNNMLVAVVADGLGGLGGGDIASNTAVCAILAHFQNNKSCSAQNLAVAIRKANEAVYKAQTAQAKMKTTVVLFCLQDDKAFCAHLGDSRLYQFRGNNILFQTRDHSVSQMAVSVGEISQDEIRHHIDRNKLLRALGADESVSPDLSELSINRNDGILLCSDGFWEHILEKEMLQCFLQSKNADGWLTQMRGILEPRITENSDNYSAIAVVVK